MEINKTFNITTLCPADIPSAVEEFQWAVYDGDRNQAELHLAGHNDGSSATFIARAEGSFAGYVTIRWESNYEPFQRDGIPFIHHLEVFHDFQRRRIGTALMDAAERLIATRAARVCICVGLFTAYGPAQRLYVKRGYIPDGRGVCDGHRPLREGETVTIDHNLLFWLIKDLRVENGDVTTSNGTNERSAERTKRIVGGS